MENNRLSRDANNAKDCIDEFIAEVEALEQERNDLKAKVSELEDEDLKSRFPTVKHPKQSITVDKFFVIKDETTGHYWLEKEQFTIFL